MARTGGIWAFASMASRLIVARFLGTNDQEGRGLPMQESLVRKSTTPCLGARGRASAGCVSAAYAGSRRDS